MKTEEEDPENTTIDDLPNELLQLIMNNLETEDVITAGQTCRRWLSVSGCQQKAEKIEASWKMSDYVPTPAEVSCASLLVKHGHLHRQVITTKAVEIEASWSNGSPRGFLPLPGASFYIPSPAEVHCASSLAAHGHLPRQVITNMADKIAESLDNGTLPSLLKLQCAASLATHGYVTQLEMLRLCDLDTSLVPAEDLRSLVTCSGWVLIYNVTGDLSPMFSSVQWRRITIFNTSLSTADTRALVAAMDTRVKRVMLGGDGTLDMEKLAHYDGTGECEQVELCGNTRERHTNRVKAWAENMGWQVKETSDTIIIKRK